jgi:EmrB/QacA subfamily drug resistance transporter
MMRKKENNHMDKQPDVSTTSTTKAAQDIGRRLRGVALFSVLAALMLTLLLEALDQTVVGTALPRIIGSLQGFDRYTWAVTAYTLASVIMIPTVGKLSDQFGRKWFLIAGTTIFLVGSALSGASQTMNELIAFRALQGLGAGIGIALVFTVVGDIFSPAERAKWQGIFGVVYGVSNLVGPTLGGWLTDHGPLLGNLVTDATRWRWVFYINLPLGILALAALLVYLPTNISIRNTRYTGWAAVRRIDFIGAIMVAAATICLLLGLTWGGNQTYDWSSVQVIGVLVASGLLYVLFFIAERFVAEPVLPLALFRNRVFAAASLLSLLQLMVLVGLIIYLPLFLQGVLGESATNAGAIITPLTISSVIGAAVAGALVATFKRYQLVTIIGGIVATAGVFLLTTMTISTNLLQAAIFMVIAGLGLGVFFSVLTLAAQNALPRTSLGVGTGAVRFLGQLGGVLGVAIVGSVVNGTLATDIVNRLPAQTVQRLTPAGVKFATNPQVLVNSTYHDTVVQTAQSFAVRSATANVPPGPQHAQIAAQAIHQTNTLLNSVFAALKESLAVAIQHGFIAVLFFCGATVLVTFFLNDIPLSSASAYMASQADSDDTKNESSESVETTA